MISEKEILGLFHLTQLIPPYHLTNLRPPSFALANYYPSTATGHFTQLVWKNTTQVGCSRKECNAGQQGGHGDAPGWYVVCEYAPAGNVIGAFVDNVQEQTGGEECPMGAVCSGGSGLTGSVGVVWVAVLVSCLGVVWM